LAVSYVTVYSVNKFNLECGGVKLLGNVFNSYYVFALEDRKASQTSLHAMCGERSGSGTVQTSSVLYYCYTVASGDNEKRLSQTQ
jgi:hypothetical protein